MASPLPSPGFSPAPQGTIPDVLERSMKLKVLYTFDESKTNCLARWPHVVNVKTVVIEQATIGVVELKTCIRAIVSASPEILAKLGQDYTVYAYDYSEYETPLVGQGMLSWALGSASGPVAAPAHMSSQLITGRVAPNVLGLFQGGTQETLEVKLRLVPVPTCLQTEYLNTIERSREVGLTAPRGLDPVAWKSFLDSTPDFNALANRLASSTPLTDPPQNSTGMEILGMLMEQGQPDVSRLNTQSFPMTSAVNSPQNPYEEPLEFNTPSGSPAPSCFNAGVEFQEIAQGMQSRPVSRASISSRRQSIRPGPVESRPTISRVFDQANESGAEEGPARKRARVTPANWDGKSNLPAPESLRVAASTAASMRLQRPVALPHNKESLEGPPRVPTPRPESQGPVRSIARPSARSRLGQAAETGSITENSSGYQPVYSSNSFPTLDDSVSSPEDTRGQSCSNSPYEMPSSPPVLPMSFVAPSSPSLPMMHLHHDSGFMSGPVDDALDGPENAGPSQIGELRMCHEVPGPQELLPTRILPRTNKSSRPRTPSAEMDRGKSRNASKSRAGSRRPSIARPQSRGNPYVPSSDAIEPPIQQNAGQIVAQYVPPPPRTLSRAPSVGTLRLPPVPVSDPVQPGPGTLSRSQTWSGANHPMSDAPIPLPAGNSVPPRSGSGAARKRAIQEKLISAVEAGEMPAFCDNCGAIETPTWRKAWSKLLNGTSESLGLDKSEVQGAYLSIQVSGHDEDGNANLFKVIKKTLVQSDDGFAEMTLCNPCGLWLSKFKSMRPEEKWIRQQKKDPPEKRKRKNPRKKLAANATSPAEGEGGSVVADQATPSEAADGDVADDETQAADPTDRTSLPPFVPDKRRATSAEPPVTLKAPGSSMDKASAEAALRLAIQSSPARLTGGVDNIPIDMNTMGSTRRLLFPSPRKAGETKLIGDDAPALSALSPNKKQRLGDAASVQTSQPDSEMKEGKENQTEFEEDEFADLFEMGELGPPMLDRTPPPRRSPRNHKSTKTPSRPVPNTPLQKSHSSLTNFFTSAARAELIAPASPSPRRSLNGKTPQSLVSRHSDLDFTQSPGFKDLVAGGYVDGEDWRGGLSWEREDVGPVQSPLMGLGDDQFDGDGEEWAELVGQGAAV
ncbi:MAG: hypothetical protein M1814_004195 [Vezdaea aestivalis]|nr:MAG: hypothetical protein M1814_004195 [Vezdaea aestivalis]